MFRVKNPSAVDGEVSVQKVEKIEPNLVTNTTTVAVVTKPVHDVSVSRQKKVIKCLVKGVLSKEEIDDYIEKKKQQFVQP